MNAGKVTLYALSTCGWCKKTRELLDGAGIEYQLFYVDLLSEEERRAAVEEARRYNPRGSYPTLVAGDRVVVGFDEGAIREALGI